MGTHGSQKEYGGERKKEVRGGRKGKDEYEKNLRKK
jgi:hypothetical protein